MMPHHWRPLAHEQNSIFKCKQHTCTLHDPWGPEKYDIKLFILFSISLNNNDVYTTLSRINVCCVDNVLNYCFAWRHVHYIKLLTDKVYSDAKLLRAFVYNWYSYTMTGDPFDPHSREVIQMFENKLKITSIYINVYTCTFVCRSLSACSLKSVRIWRL